MFWSSTRKSKSGMSSILCLHRHLASMAAPPPPSVTLKLNMLQDNVGAVQKKRRIGRGIGSSKGKTSGRGHKGQKARAGRGIPVDFEGGQTKFWKSLPKRGFRNTRHATPMVPLNVGTIQDYIDMGRLSLNKDNKNTILTLKDFVNAGMVPKSKIKHGIKLLGDGADRFKTPNLQLQVSRASKAAIQAIESVPGGQVQSVHYNRLALRALLSPERFSLLPKRARPPPKWHAYYTHWDDHRGYLSVQGQMQTLTNQRPELGAAFDQALAERLEKLNLGSDDESSKEPHANNDN